MYNLRAREAAENPGDGLKKPFPLNLNRVIKKRRI